MANGIMKLQLNRKSRYSFLREQFFVVTGGPFHDCPPDMRGVKMAAEIKKACDVDIPTQDFSVPDSKKTHRGLNKTLDLILVGEPVYVGCMGGIGRTGLFMAVLAKAFGYRDPVKYVRAQYLSHAVEKQAQHDFIKNFRITPTERRKIKLARRRALYRFWRWNRRCLTNMPQTIGQQAEQSVRQSIAR